MTYAKIDFSATSDDIKTFVSLPDSGVLRRFTSDLAPPGASGFIVPAACAPLAPSRKAGGGGPDARPSSRILETRLTDRAARGACLVCSLPPPPPCR